MRINEASKLVGIPAKTIRYYEEEGLLHPVRESENGYRTYGEAELQALRKIRLLRQLSVPMEEIRNLQEGTLLLSDCMERHVILLEREQRNLSEIADVCRNVAKSGVTLGALDAAACEEKIRQMEEGGVRFMSTKNDRRKKLVAPVVVSCLVTLMMSGLIALVLWADTKDPVPWWFLAMMVAIFVGIIVGVLLALRERMREIQKGEEDEAIQY